MSLDPKKDPSRRSIPVAEWPEIDRRAWQAALVKGDILEPGGDASEWAPHSVRKVSSGYGRWIGFLDRCGLLVPGVEPTHRLIPERVRDYIGELRASNSSSYSVLSRVGELRQAITAMTPGENLRWLRLIENRLRHEARPVRDKTAALTVRADALFEFGVELMAKTDEPQAGSPLKRARQYRDGLQIAVLIARPLRRRNFAMIELGRHLAREGEQYWIRFDGYETKTGRPIETPLPIELVPYIEAYLSDHRPILLARDGRWKRNCRALVSPEHALWVSNHGSRMTEIAIYFRIRKLTRERFGHPINPHQFRDVAGTSTAVEDPEHVHIVRSVLEHTTLQSGERYYIHARSLEASRRFQAHVLELRKRHHRKLRG